MSDNIYKKLLAIQGELVCQKSQVNKFGNYRFRSCEDILESVKPLCKKYNVSLTISDKIELIGDRYYVRSEAVFVDIEGNTDVAITSTAYARECEDKKGMDSAQITGAASSYARKYALNGLFAIDDTKDADTEENKTEKPKKDRKTYLNPEFLKLMEGYKAELGENEYYAILGAAGYEKSNQIPPNKQESCLKAFAGKLEILKTEGGR